MSDLEPKELKIIHQIVTWDKYRRKSQMFINKIILILGILLIMVTIYYAVKNSANQWMLYIISPGLFSGILLIWLHIIIKNTGAEKSEVARLFRKLWGEKLNL